MASGKKNYFRHSFSASKDPKVMNLITKFGKEAYFHYFRLVELCASIAIERSEPQTKFLFHKRTVCAELMVTPQRLGGHLLAIQSSLLGHLVVTGDMVEIEFPNLPKYLGRYESKITSNSPKKRKGKKRKEKENTDVHVNDPDARNKSIIDLFNSITGSKFQYGKANLELINARFKDGYTLEDFKMVIEYKYNSWKGDEKSRDYIQPSTFFRPTNFENYINQASRFKSTPSEEKSSGKAALDLFETKLGKYPENNIVNLKTAQDGLDL